MRSVPGRSPATTPFRSHSIARAVGLVLVVLAAGCSLGAGTRAHATTTGPLAKGHRLCPSEDLHAVVQIVNGLRRRSGLHLLGTDAHLTRFASTRSAAMAAESRLSHSGWERALRKAGLVDDQLGENVAYNYDTPDAVVRGWMQSPGHRDNILRPDFKRIGVGCVVDARGHRWWTQDFAG
jgi:uncharacterized protein YkwD